MKLANKIAIITGAAGGMGQAAAILFAREGAKVAVVDLTESAAAPTVEQITKQGGVRRRGNEVLVSAQAKETSHGRALCLTDASHRREGFDAPRGGTRPRGRG
jgi:NAD(P)-dependent dehydrogenase (short-subunit alcohol dehydrogenase family)